MKSQSSRFETTAGATFHMAQSYRLKLVGCKWQGFTKPRDKSKEKRAINGFKQKDTVSDWENPLATQPVCMQERLLMFALFLPFFWATSTSVEKHIICSYVVLSLRSTHANTSQPALPWARVQSAHQLRLTWACADMEAYREPKLISSTSADAQDLHCTNYLLPALRNTGWVSASNLRRHSLCWKTGGSHLCTTFSIQPNWRHGHKAWGTLSILLRW